jgi:hypothetical protein
VTLPLTDRDRLLKAEARVAELEEELAAWQAGDARSEPRPAAERVYRLGEVLRPQLGGHAKTAARVLIDLLDHAGQVRPGWRIGETMAVRHCEQPEDLAKAGVCYARRALRGMGFGEVLKTAWGVGYVIHAADAPAVRTGLGMADV